MAPPEKSEAEADVEQVGEGHGQAGEQRMQQVEQRREEHEGELHRLGDAGEEGGQGHRQEQPADQLAPLRRALRYIARQAAGRPNIITGNIPAMNWPPFGSPAK